jgi:hypothetical protein
MVAVIHTALQVITVGLGLAGFDLSRSRDPESVLNQRRFKAFYGSSYGAITDLWEDLVITPIDEARIDLDNDCLETFFVAMFFLKTYSTEHIMAGIYKHSEIAVRGYWMYYCAKVQALKDQVIVWPEEWADQEKEFVCFTVDGVHCRTRERGHPTLYRDTDQYSHKFHQAAFVYELAISIREPRLVHMAGPFDASVNDLKVFQEAGLIDKVPPGKRGIADSAYSAESDVISYRNPNDEREVKKFKARALARHESFNNRIKMFGCLEQRFRHKHEDHQMVFEAVCVIVQYQIDNGSPIFDV